MDSDRLEVKRKFSFVRKQEVMDRLGFAADFCVICGTVRPFKILSVSEVPTFIGIPVGLRTFISHRGECRICRSRYPREIDRYARLISAPTRSVENLAKMTNPEVFQTYTDRLEWERLVEVAPKTLRPELRKELLDEIFALAAPHFDRGHGSEGRRMLGLRLAKLQPAEEEIRECLQALRARNEKIGTKLRTASVMRLFAA